MVMKAKKLNRKAIVGSLAVLAGFSTIGSVVGTVAWYQYSTMVTTSINGANAGVSTNLQIAVGEVKAGSELSYKSDLTKQDIKNYLTANSKHSETLKPITTGNQEKDKAITNMYSHPVYQYFGYDSWVEASKEEYVEFPVTLRVDKSSNATVGDRDIFITDLKFANGTGENNIDITDALRVEFSCGEKHMLVSKNGATINTHGNLDLNKDGREDFDKGLYEFDTNKEAKEYGDANSTQSAYKLDEIKPADEKGKLTGGISIGTLSKNSTLTITVRIWLEGWQTLEASSNTINKSLWNDNTMGSTFNIGMTFAMSTEDNTTTSE